MQSYFDYVCHKRNVFWPIPGKTSASDELRRRLEDEIPVPWDDINHQSSETSETLWFLNATILDGITNLKAISVSTPSSSRMSFMACGFPSVPAVINFRTSFQINQERFSWPGRSVVLNILNGILSFCQAIARDFSNIFYRFDFTFRKHLLDFFGNFIVQGGIIARSGV